MKKILPVIVLYLLITNCNNKSISHLSSGDATQENKCYEKSLKPIKEIYFSNKKLPIYSGDNYETEKVYLEEKKVVIRKGGPNWVEKKDGRWCRIQQSEISKTIILVKDTLAFKKFEFSYATKFIERKNEVMAWVKAVCPDQLNLIKPKLCSELIKLELIKGCESDQILTGLKKYQQENNLPVGNFDYKTLKHLGIEI